MLTVAAQCIIELAQHTKTAAPPGLAPLPTRRRTHQPAPAACPERFAMPCRCDTRLGRCLVHTICRSTPLSVGSHPPQPDTPADSSKELGHHPPRSATLASDKGGLTCPPAQIERPCTHTRGVVGCPQPQVGKTWLLVRRPASPCNSPCHAACAGPDRPEPVA